MGGNLGMMGASGASAPSQGSTMPPMPGASSSGGGPGAMLSALSGGGANMDYMSRPRAATGMPDPSVNTTSMADVMGGGSVTPGSGGSMTPMMGQGQSPGMQGLARMSALSGGSGGTPAFGSMAPLAGMFLGNQAAPRATGGFPGSGGLPGSDISQMPIQQPQPNPSPAWQDLPTTAPQPAPAPAPDPAASRPPPPGDWAAQFFGSGMGSPSYGPENAMAKLRGWSQNNPEGVQRWIDAGHVPPMRGGQR